MPAYTLFKPGVKLLATPALARMLWAIGCVVERYGRSLTVSCGTESHLVGAHVTGEALDLSVSGLTPIEIVETYHELVRRLGGQFFVQIEAPLAFPVSYQPLLDLIQINPSATALHIHLQRRAGTVYPPLAG